MCLGISTLWMNANLIGEEAKFIARIERIRFVPTDTLKSQIIAVKDKVKANNKSDLTDDDLALLEINAMYDSIALFQSPRLFPEALGGEYMQDDSIIVGEIAESDAIKDRGGLYQAYQQVIFGSNTQGSTGDESELSNYFKKMELMINGLSPPPEGSLCFLLSSGIHAISVKYDVEKKTWSIMDINQWSEYMPRSFVKGVSSEPRSALNTIDLVNTISKAEGFNNAGMSTFTIKLFTTNNQEQKDKLKDDFNSFKQILIEDLKSKLQNAKEVLQALRERSEDQDPTLDPTKDPTNAPRV